MNLPNEFSVTTQQHDAITGSPGRCDNCVLARAIKRTLASIFIEVFSVEVLPYPAMREVEVVIYAPGGEALSYCSGEQACEYAMLYDRDLPNFPVNATFDFKIK